jgi:hypothetical protein
MFVTDAPFLAQHIASSAELISSRARDGAPLACSCEDFGSIVDAVDPGPTQTGARLNLQRN